MENGRVLVVEDDHELREAITDTLEMENIAYLAADCAEVAWDLLQINRVSMVITDVNMPGMDGYELLQKIRKQFALMPVVIMTAYGSVSKAVEAIRNGAIDYIVKPFEPQKLLRIVERYTRQETLVSGAKEQPVAVDPETIRTFELARKVAANDATVLLMGESGTGKEVLASFIHQHSSRCKKPFIAINCAAIPENMLEATLFGHEKGAFTGAHQSSPGKFELANGGTLLLDEISEMDLGLQAKLLRVLQEREVERIGGKQTIALDVRIIATTNRNLKREVDEGRFREDLYYRLNVFPLQWKPLRQRPGDIVPLARHLLVKHAERNQAGSLSLDPQAESMLTTHSWPGNIRELDNVIQRAVILQQGGVVRAEDLLFLDEIAEGLTDLESVPENRPVAVASAPPAADAPDSAGDVDSLDDGLKRREFELIITTLKSVNGSKKKTAEKLGISPRTLRYKMARMRESGLNPDALQYG